VLIQIFDRSNSASDFDVDMSILLDGKIRRGCRERPEMFDCERLLLEPRNLQKIDESILNFH
jgi:hypothetical protein